MKWDETKKAYVNDKGEVVEIKVTGADGKEIPLDELVVGRAESLANASMEKSLQEKIDKKTKELETASAGVKIALETDIERLKRDLSDHQSKAQQEKAEEVSSLKRIHQDELQKKEVAFSNLLENFKMQQFSTSLMQIIPEIGEVHSLDEPLSYFRDRLEWAPKIGDDGRAVKTGDFMQDHVMVFKVNVLDKDKKPIPKSLPLKEALEAIAPQKEHWFKPKGNSGTGRMNSDGTGRKNINPEDIASMSLGDYEKFKKETQSGQAKINYI